MGSPLNTQEGHSVNSWKKSELSMTSHLEHSNAHHVLLELQWTSHDDLTEKNRKKCEESYRNYLTAFSMSASFSEEVV